MQVTRRAAPRSRVVRSGGYGRPIFGKLREGSVAGRSAFLVAIGFLAGAIVLSPVIAHHTPSHTKKLIKKERKKREAADAERYTKAEADSAFLESAGEVQIREIGVFVPDGDTNGTVEHRERVQNISENDGLADQFETYLTEPRLLGGKGYNLQAIEVCYVLNDPSPSGDSITRTFVHDLATGASPIENNTARGSHSPDCYSVSPASPYPPQGALQLGLRIDDSDGANTASVLGITSTWVPAP